MYLHLCSIDTSVAACGLRQGINKVCSMYICPHLSGVYLILKILIPRWIDGSGYQTSMHAVSDGIMGNRQHARLQDVCRCQEVLLLLD